MAIITIRIDKPINCFIELEWVISRVVTLKKLLIREPNIKEKISLVGA